MSESSVLKFFTTNFIGFLLLKEIELKNTITTEKAVDAQVIPEWNSAEMQEFMEWKREKMMKKLEAN